jgi:hypothetical protein
MGEFLHKAFSLLSPPRGANPSPPAVNPAPREALPTQSPANPNTSRRFQFKEFFSMAVIFLSDSLGKAVRHRFDWRLLPLRRPSPTLQIPPESFRYHGIA